MFSVLISSILLLWTHPFHVSVCEIEHNADNKSLEITHRIFIDDLEEGINRAYVSDFDLYDPHDRDLVDKRIGEYLLDHFKIYLNGKEASANYLGHEADTEAIWCYVEIEKVKSLKVVTVENSLLMEVFPDQSNIIHINYEGEVKSIQLAGDKTAEELIF